MKQLFTLFSLLFLFACTDTNSPKTDEIKTGQDNPELETMYKADQSDRAAGSQINWNEVAPRDKKRLARTYEMYEKDLIKTSNDYFHAAMIFQHGGDSTAYGMAVKTMRKAIEMDSTRSKWLLAAAIDRHLRSRNKPQIYGTQFTRQNGQPWQRAEMDTTVITDEERKEYGVETLAEQREKLKQMNLKELSSLYEESNSINVVIKVIQNQNNEAYDLSENGINDFGYYVMETKNKPQEALKIFKLNTELHPQGYNTFDSYGECLLKLNKNAEAIAAYKKSLELNPKNTNAITVLESLK